MTTFYSVWNYTVCECWGALLTKVWVLLLPQVTVLVYILVYAFVNSGMVQLMLVLTLCFTTEFVSLIDPDSKG